MKIEGPGKTGPAGGTKKSGSAKSSGPAFSSLLDVSGADETSQTSGAGGISAITAPLLVEDATQEGRKRQAYLRRGHAMLDTLEQIRDGLLLGLIPADKLMALKHRMQEQVETVDDPQLRDIMREIEIRAAVELAKLGK